MLDALQLAVARVAADQKNRTFLSSLFELSYQQHSESEWLPPLAKQLAAGDYVPRTPATFDVPKPNWHVRPGADLSVDDQVVYQYLALSIRPHVEPLLAPTEGTIRFSHYLSTRPNEWFKPAFLGWTAFRKRSVELCAHYPFVLVTDISGYYENIDIQRLVAELRACGVTGPATGMLSKCLNKWAEPRHRGIPQGQSPSDLLAEFYLTSFDRHLESEGIVHLRYLDDIRVFGNDEWSARRALHRVTSLLRDRGLNLQTAKSKIIPTGEARKQFDGVAEIVQQIGNRILKEALAGVPDLAYVNWHEVRQYLQANPSAPPTDVVQEAWAQFQVGKLGGFDKTLFHYLLGRLGDLGLKDAVPFVLATLRDRPEETGACLDYLGAVEVPAGELGPLEQLLGDGHTIFEYQKYQILKWLLERNLTLPGALNYARSAVRSGQEKLVRPYAIAYIARSGELADYDLLHDAYRALDGWNDRASIVCAMSAAPEAIKAPFFARVAGEHPLIDRALRWAKTGKK